MKWMPVDVISGLVIIICLGLIALGRNSIISYILLLTTGAYLGFDIKRERKR